MAGGHGYGMSQIGSYYLASQGQNYEQILKYFYSSGTELMKLSPTATSANGSVSCGNNAQKINYKTRTTAPGGSDMYFQPPYNYNHNRSECVWYVRGRISEMAGTSSLDKATKDKIQKSMLNTTGNGTDWWNNPSLKMYKSSNDVRQPKPGSIIVWKYGPARANQKGGNFGHVAVLESISSSGEVVVTEGWNNCNYGNQSWSCVVFKHRKFNSLEEFYNWVSNYGGGPSQYKFLGYVYIFC